jgi:hypothetical protein
MKYLNFTFIVCDPVGGKVAENFVRSRILSDPVFVFYDFPAPKSDFPVILKKINQ